MGLEDLANFCKPKQNNDQNKKSKVQEQKNEQKTKKELPKKPNISWLFYKDYFRELDYSNLSNTKNEETIKAKVLDIIKQGFFKQNPKGLGNISFELKTIYPGLILGSGNAHELPSIEGQAILGFHFDYTSGLPEISGSSIKGVLRSAFAHPDYIKEILNDITLDVKKLEIEIFGQDSKSSDTIQGNDIFFDAIIIKGDSKNKILGDDFITPHKNSKKVKGTNGELIADELCNPIPLRFIKVMPEVTFYFEFILTDNGINKEKKLDLFKQIIMDLGLGAKTNVGYGKFEE